MKMEKEESDKKDQNRFAKKKYIYITKSKFWLMCMGKKGKSY